MSSDAPQHGPDMDPSVRLCLQSMPPELMKLCKDQFGSHFIHFETWVGRVIDQAFDIGAAWARSENATTPNTTKET